MVFFSLEISPFTSTVICADKSPRATAVVTSGRCFGTCPVRFGRHGVDGVSDVSSRNRGQIAGQAIVPAPVPGGTSLTPSTPWRTTCTGQVRNIDRQSRRPWARCDLSCRSRWNVKGMRFRAEDTINTMWTSSTASRPQVTRVRVKSVPKGKFGRPGESPGRERVLEGPDRQRQLDGR